MPSQATDLRRPPRAAALPPAERRAAIASTTLELILREGGAVTTKQIAEAAGIAEGTIFRVFPDKDDVVCAAVQLALDPAPTEAAIAAIDRGQPFEDQLADAVAVVQHRLSQLWRLAAAVGDGIFRKGEPPIEYPSLVALLEPHRALLRSEPAEAAWQLRAITLAVTHPALYPTPMAPHQIVSLLLDGIRRPT